MRPALNSSAWRLFICNIGLCRCSGEPRLETFDHFVGLRRREPSRGLEAGLPLDEVTQALFGRIVQRAGCDQVAPQCEDLLELAGAGRRLCSPPPGPGAPAQS